MTIERLIILLDKAVNYIENTKEINDEYRKYNRLISLKKYINEFWGVEDYILVGFKMDDLVEFGIVYNIGENLYEDQYQSKYNANGSPANKVYLNQVRIENFLDWYLSDIGDLRLGLLELESGMMQVITPRYAFDRCEYIPEFICVNNSGSDIEYDPNDIELIFNQ